jgi:hypothetical protein
MLGFLFNLSATEIRQRIAAGRRQGCERAPVMAEVNNLVKPPSALRNPQITSRVTALMAAPA